MLVLIFVVYFGLPALGLRLSAFQAGMPNDRSIAMVRERWATRALLAAPVPAPASGTVRPPSGCGQVETSSPAIGP